MAFCGSCGVGIPEGNSFCSGCGKPVTVTNSVGPTAVAARLAPVEEKKFYENPEVLITNSRCIMGGQTFAMSGITSVRAYTEVKSRKGPIITILIGILTALINFQSNFVGVIVGMAVIAVGVLWFKGIKDVHNVLIKSASGEDKPLGHTNRQYILEVVDALNQAIVYRS